MAIKDLLKKKEKFLNHEVEPQSLVSETVPTVGFTFIRSDTNTQEEIQLPGFESDVEPTAVDTLSLPIPPIPPTASTSPKRRIGRLRGFSNASTTSQTSDSGKEGKRLSQRLHLTSKSRASSTSSVNLPADLPTIHDAYSEQGDKQEKEAMWEERATILAKENPNSTRSGLPTAQMSQMSIAMTDGRPLSSSSGTQGISDAAGDENIQEAIRLHENGDLVEATRMFGRLAETGNVLSQVLYGLSLRHGWGCQPDLPRAITYLSAAASNSANIESEALKSGLKKGGAAKGELVLAIFELANCFRHGWGVDVDKVAARQYYETAANLGDTDAMNEAAWCYVEGFGGKKDKFKAAQLLRLAEKNGAKTLGNSWIWKEKYNPR